MTDDGTNWRKADYPVKNGDNGEVKGRTNVMSKTEAERESFFKKKQDCDALKRRRVTEP